MCCQALDRARKHKLSPTLAEIPSRCVLRPELYYSFNLLPRILTIVPSPPRGAPHSITHHPLTYLRFMSLLFLKWRRELIERFLLNTWKRKSAVLFVPRCVLAYTVISFNIRFFHTRVSPSDIPSFLYYFHPPSFFTP